MKRLFVIGGGGASVVLVAFGIAAITMGFVGRGDVRHSLRQEQIVGTPDMTPKAIAAGAKAAGLKNVSVPSQSVANKKIDTGARARTFASYMRIHALEATGGQVYAEMPRFLDKSGKPTADQKLAAIDRGSGKPVENPARNVWVTETALSTALNTSYFAERVSMFSVIMGIALLLTGIGFAVLTFGALRATLARRVAAERHEVTPPRAAVIA